MADIGNATLILAIVFAVYCVVVTCANVKIGSPALARSACNSLIAVAVFYTLAVEIMLYALITDDFGIKLVANHSSTDLSLVYKFTALYSDKAGSLMFWGWLVSLFSLIFVFQKRHQFEYAVRHFAGIISAIILFFLITVMVGLDVFEEMALVPIDGRGMNAQLQNPGMAIHPPLLFLGYAGFAVIFAFLTGILICGERGDSWIGAIRRWALLAFCMLGLANLSGAWWAWDVGNWGGYWAWDPVENAGLMPWLLGVALVHSIAVSRRRQYLKAWVAALAVLAFFFTLLSPFITHGGLEDSPLHGFDDSPVPSHLLVFMGIAVIFSVGLLIKRRDRLADSAGGRSLLSRESAFLATNILLGLIVILILIGTATPGIADDFSKKVTLDRDFFDWTAAPALLLLILLMGLCPLLKWRDWDAAKFRRQFLIPLCLSLLSAVGVLLSGVGNWYLLAALVCGLVVFAVFAEWVSQTRSLCASAGKDYLTGFAHLIWRNRPRYGGFIVHLGMVLIAIGVIGSSKYGNDTIVNLMWIGGGFILAGSLVAFWPDGNKSQTLTEAD